MGDPAYKQSHKAQGLCIDCQRKAVPGYIRCADHLYNRARRQRAYYYELRDRMLRKARKEKIERINRNLCTCCGNAKDPDMDADMHQCISCREKRLERALCR